MEHSAVAYFTNGRIIVASISRSVGGDALAGPPRWFGRSAKKAIVATAIGDALAASAGGLPDPDESYWKGRFIPFQDAADVKNFKTFMRDAKCVDIDVAGGVATLTPLRNLSAKNGFESVAEDAVTLPADDMDAVTGGVLALLGLRPGDSGCSDTPCNSRSFPKRYPGLRLGTAYIGIDHKPGTVPAASD